MDFRLLIIFTGWNEPIDSTVLLQQLDRCLSTEQHEKANKVLLQIRPEDCSALESRQCILGRSGNHFLPAKVFFPGGVLGSRSLAPHLDEVDRKFSRDHTELLTALSVRSEPLIEDLLDVQNSLEMVEGHLSSSSLRLAISILEIATHLRHDLADLLIPDTSSRLRNLADIVHGEPLTISDKAGFNFTHPEISAALARRLGIESALDRAIRLEIDLESDDDGEDYTPSESLATNIGDTLERYSIADTFNEFLANADDAGATRIAWILDDCNKGKHKSSSLLTTELKPFQGPALLVYNDGSKFTTHSCSRCDDIPWLNSDQSSLRRISTDSRTSAKVGRKETHIQLECSAEEL